MHYGGGSVVKSGLLPRVLRALDEAGIAHVELGGALPNPRDDKVYEGIALGREFQADFILAVGGGSAIDSAKAIAMLAVHGGRMADYRVPHVQDAPGLPVIAIPTYAVCRPSGE